MLHLAIDKEFSYLNYLAVMSALRFNPLTLWIKAEPENNPYWELIKKTNNITILPVDPKTGITLDIEDFIGRLDIIYISACTTEMVNDAMIDHTKMYEVDGEFETDNMCLVRVYQSDLITPEYVANSNTAIANLIKQVLLERVWNVKI